MQSFERTGFWVPAIPEIKWPGTLWLESLDTLVVDATRGGVLGGPAATTRSVYRKH